MSSIQTVWGFLWRHKYLVTITFFAVMVGFVDENSLWERRQRIQEINALRAEMRTYQNQYNEDTKALDELENNPEEVVRVARERYFMKYPDEDVYVVMDEAKSEAASEPSKETGDEGTI